MATPGPAWRSEPTNNPLPEDIDGLLNPQGARQKWKCIGQALGLHSDILTEIDQECSDENKCMQMLIQCQKKCKLVWENVIKALEDHTVVEDGLALRVRMKLKFQSGSDKDSEPPRKKLKVGDMLSCKPEPQSYPVDMFKNPTVAEKYRCTHCKRIPAKAQKSQCEHNIISCESCIYKTCQINGCNWTVYKYDSKMTSNIRSLTVHCHNREEGCAETMPLSSVSGHLEQCPMQEIQCTFSVLGCTDHVKRAKMNEHTNGGNGHFAKAVTLITNLGQKLKEKKSSLVAPMHFKIGPIGRGKKKYLLEESPVFYSHQNGYKLQLKVGVHVNLTRPTSQFNITVCSLPGENDGNLTWPLNGTLSIALLNLNENQGHSVSTIPFSLHNDDDSMSEIVEKRFDSPKKYIRENGEGTLHFCITNVNIAEQSKPWLSDPTVINVS